MTRNLLAFLCLLFLSAASASSPPSRANATEGRGPEGWARRREEKLEEQRDVGVGVSADKRDVDAVADRVAARLEPLLLLSSPAPSPDAPSPPPPGPEERPKPKRSPSSLLEALLGAAVASTFLVASDRFDSRRRRREEASRTRAELLDALRDLDAATARRVLGQIALPSWATWPDFERCAFANAALAQLWPYVCLAASEAAREMINPLLEEQKPPWMTSVRITRLELGPRPPTIEGVKVFPPSAAAAVAAADSSGSPSPSVFAPPASLSSLEGSDDGASPPGQKTRGPPSSSRVRQQQSDAVVLEIDVDWQGSQAVELVVNPLPSSSKADGSRSLLTALGRRATRAVARAVKLRAGVEGVSASARLRLELGPLVGRLPVVPRLSASLVDFPRLGFGLTLYGGDVTLLPGLESWLAATLRDYAIRPFVLPGRYVVDLFEGGEEEGLGFERPKGMLFVTVDESSRVPRADAFSAADCYVEVRTSEGVGERRKGKRPGEERGEKRSVFPRTRTIPNDDSPRWRQELRPLLVRDPRHEVVDFVLMDADELGADDEVGRASLKVRDLVERSEGGGDGERRRRRGLARPPSPVSRPEVVGAAPASLVPAVTCRESNVDVEEESGFVVGGASPPLAAGAAAAGATTAGATTATEETGGRADDVASAARRFAPAPLFPSGGAAVASGSDVVVGARVGEGGSEEREGGASDEGDEEISPPPRDPLSFPGLPRPRGKGTVEDPLELWLPCARLSGRGRSSSDALSAPSTPSPAERLSGLCSAASLAVADALCLPCLPGGTERLRRRGRPSGVPSGPPLLRVRVSYHGFSEEEIALAGGEREKGEERRRRASGSIPAPLDQPLPPLATPSSSPSRAADVLGGGILFVRPRKARNLPQPPAWRRLLRKEASWVVRVSVAGGVSEEGGPVSRGGTSPEFTEAIELVLGSKDLQRARREARASDGPDDATISLQVLDASYSGVDDDGRRRRARVAGEATVRWRDLMATGVLQGEFPLARFEPGTDEGELLESEAEAGAGGGRAGEGRTTTTVESSRRRRSLLRAPPRGYDAGTDAGMTSSAFGEGQATLSAELAWFAFV